MTKGGTLSFVPPTRTDGLRWNTHERDARWSDFRRHKIYQHWQYEQSLMCLLLNCRENHGDIWRGVLWPDSPGAGGSCQHDSGEARARRDRKFHTTSGEASVSTVAISDTTSPTAGRDVWTETSGNVSAGAPRISVVGGTVGWQIEDSVVTFNLRLQYLRCFKLFALAACWWQGSSETWCVCFMSFIIIFYRINGNSYQPF